MALIFSDCSIQDRKDRSRIVGLESHSPLFQFLRKGFIGGGGIRSGQFKEHLSGVKDFPVAASGVDDIQKIPGVQRRQLVEWHVDEVTFTPPFDKNSFRYMSISDSTA